MKNVYFKKPVQEKLPPQPLFMGRPFNDTEALFKAFSPNRLLRMPQYQGLLASLRMSVYYTLAGYEEFFKAEL